MFPRRRLHRAVGPARGPPEPYADPDDGAAQADKSLRGVQLAMDTHPAEEVGRVGTARGKKPATGVLAAQRRSRCNPPQRGNREACGPANPRALWEEVKC